MEKYICYKKDTGLITMVSDDKNIVDSAIYEQRKLDLTDEEWKEFYEAGDRLYKGKLILKPDERKVKAQKLDGITDRLEEATTMAELKTEILNILEIIK